ncbi:parathyroid hormone-like [Betta splendens]|uniref:Parathyroid hormone n=1 Tax=Betta splendens TaxID=158456 RepID=A0A8M1HFP8_BETSP|nr:parathyroid hormone-like [Betta splendens]
MVEFSNYKRKLEESIDSVQLIGANHQTRLTSGYTANRGEAPPEVIKVNMQNLDYKILLILFFFLHLSCLCEGRPHRKRTVSEVQLMHNLGEHKHVQARQEWLQTRLWGIHTASAQDGRMEVDQVRSSDVNGSPLQLEDLPDLTSEEIQNALTFLEKLLKSKQS